MILQNKKSWYSHLKYVLWDERISTKIYIGTSPFQLVYGDDAVLPIHIILLAMALLQDEEEEPNNVQKSFYQLIKVQ